MWVNGGVLHSFGLLRPVLNSAAEFAVCWIVCLSYVRWRLCCVTECAHAYSAVYCVVGVAGLRVVVNSIMRRLTDCSIIFVERRIERN